MPWIERPGFRMHFELREQALPFDTVFLHGNLASNLWWEPAAELLQRRWAGSAKGRLILAEWRGCGKSRKYEGEFRLQEAAADCNALLDYLDVKSCHLVGHSTGGLIGLYAMASRPSLYRRALLLDPVSPWGLKVEEPHLRTFQRMEKDRDFCASVILSTLPPGVLPPAFADRIVDDAFQIAPQNWLGVPRSLRSPPDLNWENLRQPILVAQGELDQVLPADGAKRLADKLPSGEFRWIPGRGHCANLECPAEFAGLAQEFLFNAVPI